MCLISSSLGLHQRDKDAFVELILSGKRQQEIIIVNKLQFSCSVVSDSVTPWTAACKAFCPSQTPRAYSNSCPLSRWCHPAISSSVIPFSLLPPSIFPSIRVFSSESVLHIRWPKYSASTSVLPMNTQGWFPLGWTGWISLQSKGLFKSLFQQHSSKASILWHSGFFIVQLSHPYMTTGKSIALTRWTFVGKVMSLIFNILFRFVTAFLPRSKCLFKFHGCSHHLQWFGSPKR